MNELEKYLENPDLNFLATSDSSSPLCLMSNKTSEPVLKFFEMLKEKEIYWLKIFIGAE